MAKHFVSNLTLDETDLEIAKKFLANGKDLRPEFQPQTIAALLGQLRNPLVGQPNSCKAHIGCGGGKTLIFLLAYLIAMYKGEASKCLLTAPRHALINQHALEVDSLIGVAKANGLFPEDFKLQVVEISSQEAIKDKTGIDISSQHLENIVFVKTNNEKTLIQEHLKTEEPRLFIACTQSVKKFIGQIKGQKIFDIVVNDEYHNWISQQKNEKNNKILCDLSKKCRLMANFSATPKKGKIMSHGDAIFGPEIAGITTAQLKEWGYLKRNLQVYFVRAHETRSIDDAERQTLENRGVKDVQQFNKESVIILRVIQENSNGEIKPHVLIATTEVAIIRNQINSGLTGFVSRMRDIAKRLVLIQVDGSTKQPVRDKMMRIMKRAGHKIVTCVLQHSVMCEGLDAPNFDTAIAFRGMNDVVLNQFINRVTRWHKLYDTAKIYFQIDGDTTEEWRAQVKRYLNALWNIGLTLDDIMIEAIECGQGGGEEDPPRIPIEDRGLVDIKRAAVDFEQVILQERNALETQLSADRAEEQFLDNTKNISIENFLERFAKNSW